MGRFRLNVLGIAAIKSQPATRDVALSRAATVAATAKRIAPYQTGAYQRSIRYGVYYDKGWVGRVNAYDFKAHWIEFGTEDTPKFRVLGRALDAANTEVKLR